MPYYQTTTVEGNVIQICKHFGKRIGNALRSERHQPTPEEMETVNLRNCERKLTGLLNANFKEGDSHVTLTYFKQQRVPPAQARKYVKKFLREMRKEFRQHGTVMKYILVTEYEKTAIHHHLIINDINDASLLQIVKRHWRYGSTKHTTLYSVEFSQLAAYLIKETKDTFRKKDGSARQRYSCSRNLIRPKATTELISKARVWLKEPRAPKGWFIPSNLIFNGTDWQGRPYQRYTMIKLTAGHPPQYLSLDEQLHWWEDLLEIQPENKQAKSEIRFLKTQLQGI